MKNYYRSEKLPVVTKGIVRGWFIKTLVSLEWLFLKSNWCNIFKVYVENKRAYFLDYERIFGCVTLAIFTQVRCNWRNLLRAGVIVIGSPGRGLLLSSGPIIIQFWLPTYKSAICICFVCYKLDFYKKMNAAETSLTFYRQAAFPLWWVRH